MINRKLGPVCAMAAGVLAVGFVVAPASAGPADPSGSPTASPTTPAPPPVGTTTVVQGPVSPIALWAHGPTSTGAPWGALLVTRGPSDGYVVDNTFPPGSTTGWHQHPGWSVIFVKDGTITDYDSSTPGCKAQTFSKGMSFTDTGGADVHMLRNEGTEVAETVAVQFIPGGQPRKTTAAEPANCHVS